MDFVLGVNVPTSSVGRELHDGSACILSNRGIEGVVAEERITRVKRAGGYGGALKSLLCSLDIDPKNIGLVVTSSCCDLQWADRPLPEFASVPTISCNHHLSHAFGVFCTSGFDESIIAVLDSGGNSFNRTAEDWWRTDREQQSYFVGNSKSISLLSRDCSEAEETGIGEIYRAATYYLGWRSSQYAGKVMALAAHGVASQFSRERLFSLDELGRIQSPISNDPLNPLAMIEQLFRVNRFKGFSPRGATEPICEDHANFAAWIQAELERILIAKVDFLVRDTGIPNVCLSGGVAYNCKAAFKLRSESIAGKVYIGPASGDHGQSFGNALYGLWYRDRSVIPRVRMKVFTGPPRHRSPSEIREKIAQLGDYELLPTADTSIVATYLAAGEVIGCYQGRSEFGPRALGNRSILAMPSLTSIASELNEKKGRESFMPFAPAVLEEYKANFFELDCSSPYMATCGRVKSQCKEVTQGVTSVDGTARIQTVSKDDNPEFHELLTEYGSITGIPMLLNTSFNGIDEPLVESIDDAIRGLMRLKLDGILIDGLYFRRIALPIREISFTKIFDKEKVRITIPELVRFIRTNVSHLRLIPRDRFLLFEDFVQWIRDGRKSTTIRYKEDSVDYPISTRLPVYSTRNFRVRDSNDIVGEIQIESLTLKRFCELDSEDAIRDGFENLDELIVTLKGVYRDIGDSNLVSIYGLHWL